MSHEDTSIDPKELAVVDLVVITFFFLLQVGVYTPPLTDQWTRTTQIRRKDLQFWKRQPTGGIVCMSPMAPLAELRQADSVTITLDNQKNGQHDTVTL
jgi:hypothetical protein